MNRFNNDSPTASGPLQGLKAAVIGLGVMGRNHARIYRSLPEIKSVMAIDPDPKAGGRAMANMVPICCWRVAGGYKVMKDDGIRIASITAPTSQHASLAIDAMELGIHVLVEKPIADDTSDARAMIDCAKMNDRILMVGHIVRFDPITDFIKVAISNGSLGGIWRISTRRIGPSPDRIRDVGVTVDLATHDIDAMRYILGQEPWEVAATIRYRDHGDEYEDQVDGWIEFSDGATGVIEADWLTPIKHRSMVVCGSRGMMVADYVGRTVKTAYRNSGSTAMRSYPAHLFHEPLKAEISAFVNCVIEGVDPPVSGEDGLIALRTALAMVDSAALARPVEL